MAKYTFVCKTCGRTLESNNYEKSKVEATQPHLDLDNYVCSDYFVRDYSPPVVILKGEDFTKSIVD